MCLTFSSTGTHIYINVCVIHSVIMAWYWVLFIFYSTQMNTPKQTAAVLYCRKCMYIHLTCILHQSIMFLVHCNILYHSENINLTCSMHSALFNTPVNSSLVEDSESLQHLIHSVLETWTSITSYTHRHMYTMSSWSNWWEAHLMNASSVSMFVSLVKSSVQTESCLNTCLYSGVV